MADNSAERVGFVPRPPESSDRVAVKPPSRISRINEFIGRNKLGLGAFIAALGMSPVIATGKAEDMVDRTDNAIHGTVGAVTDKAASIIIVPDTQKANTEKVRKQLESKGRKFGEPVVSAMDRDPKTGEDGIVYEHGSWGDVSTSGTVGVRTKAQPLIVRSEPSTNGKVVSAEELEKLGVNLDDVWMTTVVGGPYDVDVNNPKDVREKDWMKTDIDGKPLYTAKKFAKFDEDGRKELRIEAPDGKTIILPFNPISSNFSYPANK